MYVSGCCNAFRNVFSTNLSCQKNPLRSLGAVGLAEYVEKGEREQDEQWVEKNWNNASNTNELLKA